MIKIFEKAFQKWQKITSTIKQRTKEEVQLSEFHIQTLADMIKRNINTNHKQKQLLNITFHRYELQEDDLNYIVETRGEKEEHLLTMKIKQHNDTLFQYFSDEKQKNIKIPTIIFKRLNTTN